MMGKTSTNHDVTTTVLHSRDGVLLNVGCSILFPNMGCILAAKILNFGFVRLQNFFGVVIIMLEIGFSKFQSGFYVKFFDHESFARTTGFSTVTREAPNL